MRYMMAFDVKYFAICALLAIAVGCSEDVQVHFYDQEALAALEQYDPKYELNSDGRIVILKLDNKEVNDATLEHVKDLTELKTLSLYGSSITDDGLALLKNLGRLYSLGLGKTAISNRGLKHLVQIPNLRQLWIAKSKITKRGASALKKKCPDLKVYE